MEMMIVLVLVVFAISIISIIHNAKLYFKKSQAELNEENKEC